MNFRFQILYIVNFVAHVVPVHTYELYKYTHCIKMYREGKQTLSYAYLTSTF